MTTKGISEILTGDNLRTYIAEQHYQREIATGAINGTGTQAFTTTHKIEAVIGNATLLTGWQGSPQPQYTNSAGNYYRRDCFVEYMKAGKISPLNTNTYPVTIKAGNATGSITISGSLPASVAGSIVLSYSASIVERSDEITNVSISGGGRPNSYVVVQNGKRIKIEGVQEQRTVSIEALNLPGYGWVDYLNGAILSNSIDNSISGSDLLKGTTGATDRAYSKTVVFRQIDPLTGNQVLDALFNVSQVSNDTNRPSENQATETAAFECSPQDYTRISILNGQG